MFTILENYKALMKMCMSAQMAGVEGPSVQQADINADGWLDKADLDAMSPQAKESLKRAMGDISSIEQGASMRIEDMINSGFLKERGETISHTKASETAFAQTSPGTPETTVWHTETQTVPATYQPAVQADSVSADYETVTKSASYPVYTVEDFKAPSLDTFNGKKVTQLDQFNSVPADGSALVVGEYYRDSMNQILSYQGNCFHIEQGPQLIPGSNPQNEYAETFQKVCGPYDCPILDTYVPVQPEPQIVFQPYAPYIPPISQTPVNPGVPYTPPVPFPEPLPPTEIEINCNGLPIHADHVMKYGQYDVYLAKGKIFRINNITGEVEDREFAGDRTEFIGVDDIRRNIHTVMQQGEIINTFLGFETFKARDNWERVGNHGNICTPIPPRSETGDGVGGGVGGGGNSDEASAPSSGGTAGEAQGGNSF